MKYQSLNGKSILITGASKGIGKAISEELLDSQANLLLMASKIESFDSSLANLQNVRLYSSDFANAESLANALSQIHNENGTPDIIINNAGIGVFRNFAELSQEDIRKMMEINYFAPLSIVQYFMKEMMERKSGNILNILSVTAQTNYQRSSVYGASKSALLETMKTLRLEVRQSGLRIINILPGATATTIWRPKVIEDFGWKMLTPQSVAKTVLSTLELCISTNQTIEELVLRPDLGDL